MTVTPKPTGGVGMNPVANALSIVLLIAILGAAWIMFGGSAAGATSMLSDPERPLDE